MPSLLPDTFIDNTTHLYLPQVRARSMLLYALVLGAIVVAAIAAFFIKIDISFGAGGVVRSVAEKTELRPLVSGRVMQVHARENQAIRTGDTLLVLAPEIIEEKIRLNRFQQAEHQLLLQDLQRLTNEHESFSPLLGDALRSSLIAQQYNQFQVQLQENTIRRDKVGKELKADRYLHREKVVATRELDAKEAEYKQLQEEYRGIIQRQLTQWQADLNTHKLTLSELKAVQQQLLKEQQLYTIKAPVGGTIQQWAGKYEGSFVQAGEALGVISPDSNLLVECYVNPADMGLLKMGQKVLFQIDALNYREWGLARGTVIDIAKDFTIVAEKQPTFKVKCRLETSFLKLKNGYQATLQKGMTLQARFVVTRRTLAQLVFDKVDDWLNPNMKQLK